MALELIIPILGIVVASIIGLYQIIQNSRKYEEKNNKLSIGRKHNLPQRYYFTGRKKEIIQLINAINSRSYIITVLGIGGIGKTALALEVLYEMLEKSKYDKIIWISAKRSVVNLEYLCDVLIDVFGKSEIIKCTFEEKIVEVNNLIHNYKCVIAIDNFENVKDEKVISFIENIPEPSKILITSRESQLNESKHIILKGLNFLEALELMKYHSSEIGYSEFDSISQDNLKYLTELTGGIPLALKWAIGNMNTRSMTIEEIFDNLYSAKGEIFDFIFKNSWGMLADNPKNILYLLSIYETPLNRYILCSSLNIKYYNFDNAISILINLSLVETIKSDTSDNVKYTCHEMTKYYVKSKIDKNLYIHLNKLAANSLILKINKDITNNLESYSFIESQLENILQCCRFCFDYNWENGKTILFLIKWYLWEKGLWNIRNDYYLKCINSSKALLTDENIFQLSVDIAWVYFRQGQRQKFEEWLMKAENVKTKRMPLDIMGTYYSVLGMYHKSNDNFEKSNQYLLQALDCLPNTKKNQLERMRVLTYLGELYRQFRKMEEAKSWFNDTLELAKKFKYNAGICWSYQNLATIELINGNIQEAKSFLNKGLIIAEKINRTHTIAECKFLLAEIYKKDNIEKSEKLFRDASSLYEQLGFKGQYNAGNR